MRLLERAPSAATPPRSRRARLAPPPARLGALAAAVALVLLAALPGRPGAAAPSRLAVSIGQATHTRIIPSARTDLAHLAAAVPRAGGPVVSGLSTRVPAGARALSAGARALPGAAAPRPSLLGAASGRALAAPDLPPYQSVASLLRSARSAAGEVAVPRAAAASPRAAAKKGAAPAPAQVLHNFDALNVGDDLAANAIALGTGFLVEPPDQGLCVGPGGALEAVNDVVRAYSLAGDPLDVPVSLDSFFGELPQLFISDPRCSYDPASGAYVATALVIDDVLEPVSTFTHLDVAVDVAGTPAGPWTVFQIDTTDLTSLGCPCFGDQPLLGVDRTGVYVSTNEFSVAAALNPPSDPTGLLGFHGAHIYAIDKAQLLALASSSSLLAPAVNVVHYSGMRNGGVPAASMEPALDTAPGSPAEYFLDSLDPGATTDDRLGVWAITDEGALDTGGTPTLSGVVITSQTYGQPPLAQERQPAGQSNVLNTDDDRMLQVQNVGGTLWASLDTVVRPIGDTANRSGAAWFEVVPTLSGTSPATVVSASIAAQGIVAVKGAYLLYPALAVNDMGHPQMIMGESGAAAYPSVVIAGGSTFGSLSTVYQNPTFDVGFSCSPCRWGDYSAAVWSSVPTAPGRTASIWLATEDLLAQGFSNGNWSTRIVEVIPQGG